MAAVAAQDQVGKKGGDVIPAAPASAKPGGRAAQLAHDMKGDSGMKTLVSSEPEAVTPRASSGDGMSQAFDGAAIRLPVRVVYETGFDMWTVIEVPDVEGGLERVVSRSYREADAHAIAAALTAGQWRTMDSAPKDRPILVLTNAVQELAAFMTVCQWHPDAGFCVDELREPVLWQPLPAPPPKEK